MNLVNKILDHRLGDFEIGDHPVPHGANGFDRAGGPSQHLLGVIADGQHLFATAFILDRHHRRLVQNNAAAFYINERVGGA